ncbi:S8 family serine peptidase [Rubeoparvulum massiliense]|uniref:S8 family serine peptidase n=1 Tax=Rubeoparvulum massiliense TaxID=1631346 RepID=UPI00065E0580|nr:S8 family serine peptidase [Rubeoparvulum massiliense]
MKKRQVATLFGIIFLSISFIFSTGYWAYGELNDEAEAITSLPAEWIIKWQGDEFPIQDERITILSKNEKQKTAKITLNQARDEKLPPITIDLIEEWRNRNDVCYLYPNKKVKISTTSTIQEPYVARQYYLDRIRAKQAWNIQADAPDVTIAVLDTGIWLDHPDLKGQLVEGYNILNPNLLPYDNNGHGTNVAGILAAKHNNGLGIMGVVGKTNIMPIKVLDGNGEGDEYDVTAGIYQAVDAGAQIILLSLGDVIYSPYMEEAIVYAENNGVFVVAATGNEGSRVNYPAAFPTVLSVGAIDKQGRIHQYSNSGPEIDVVAPGAGIFTTGADGGYMSNDGTSMAAPQVAGLAALIKQQYPEYTPRQVRQLIITTTTNLSGKEWNTTSGFGLINMYQALLENGVPIPMNNTSKEGAYALPISTERVGQFTWENSSWYRIDLPYSGEVNLTLSMLDEKLRKNPGFAGTVQVDLYPVGSPASTILHQANEPLTFKSRAGTVYLKLTPYADLLNSGSHRFLLENKFHITADAYESNDTKATAKRIPVNSTITANYHQENDSDWYYVDVNRKGKLSVDITTDSLRMDVVLHVHGPGLNEGIKVDNGNVFNQQRESIEIEVQPGRYYFHSYNYYGFPVNAQYFLKIHYQQALIDHNEPNNVYSEATNLILNQSTRGSVSNKFDVDWYKFTLTRGQEVYIQLSYPDYQYGQLVLFTEKLDSVGDYGLSNRNGKLMVKKWLPKGKYYIRLQMTKEMEYEYYHLSVTSNMLPFNDIQSHWAKNEIVKLSDKGVISGYADHSFRPNKAITRAEVATILVRTQQLEPNNKKAKLPFKDVKQQHWAYRNLLIAYQNGFLKGYPDNTLRPDQPITRAELAQLIVSAEKLRLQKIVLLFPDVPHTHWAAEAIRIMNSYGYLHGDDEGFYRPDASTTRAEFVTVVDRVWFSSKVKK